MCTNICPTDCTVDHTAAAQRLLLLRLVCPLDWALLSSGTHSPLFFVRVHMHSPRASIAEEQVVWQECCIDGAQLTEWPYKHQWLTDHLNQFVSDFGQLSSLLNKVYRCRMISRVYKKACERAPTTFPKRLVRLSQAADAVRWIYNTQEFGLESKGFWCL